MNLNLTIKQIKSIETVAMCLLAAEIPFDYRDNHLVVKNSNILSGMTATYHVGDGHLCLMDGDYNPITIEQFVDIIRPELKPFVKIK